MATVYLGNKDGIDNSTQNLKNIILSIKITPPEDGVITSISMKVTSSANRYTQCALYERYGPFDVGVIIAETEILLVGVINGWVTFNFTIPIQLNGGQSYFISVWTANSPPGTFNLHTQLITGEGGLREDNYCNRDWSLGWQGVMWFEVPDYDNNYLIYCTFEYTSTLNYFWDKGLPVFTNDFGGDWWDKGFPHSYIEKEEFYYIKLSPGYAWSPIEGFKTEKVPKVDYGFSWSSPEGFKTLIDAGTTTLFETKVGSPTGWIWKNAEFTIDSAPAKQAVGNTGWAWTIIPQNPPAYYIPSGQEVGWTWGLQDA
jgi:hypothetical protein